MICAWLCSDIVNCRFGSTSRGTGLHAERPPRWAAGCWAAPQADRWPLAEREDAQTGVR